MVKSLVPFLFTAAIKFSGIPHKPKPPIRMVMPSRSFSIATSADAIRLSICDSNSSGALPASKECTSQKHDAQSGSVRLKGESVKSEEGSQRTEELVQLVDGIE